MTAAPATVVVHCYKVAQVEASPEILERVAKWVAALRSGEYKQGHGRLHQGDEFCCLGVACDVSGLADWKLTDDSYECLPGFCGVLPPLIQEFYGLAELQGFQVHSAIPRSLVVLNDRGVPFSVIADLIEARYRLGKWSVTA